MTSTLGRLAVVLAGALALGSCSRAEYAFLPKSASYLGTTTAAPKARRVAVAPAPVVAATPAAEVVASAPETPVAAAPVAVEAPIATAPVAAAKPMATKPQAATAEDATAATTAVPQKPSLVQRLAMAKVTKKINKLVAKTQFKRGDSTASTARLDGNLRYAIIFGVISLIFFAIGGNLLNIIGTVLLIIALLFLLFWVLDAL